MNRLKARRNIRTDRVLQETSSSYICRSPRIQCVAMNSSSKGTIWSGGIGACPGCGRWRRICCFSNLFLQNPPTTRDHKDRSRCLYLRLLQNQILVKNFLIKLISIMVKACHIIYASTIFRYEVTYKIETERPVPAVPFYRLC